MYLSVHLVSRTYSGRVRKLMRVIVEIGAYVGEHVSAFHRIRTKVIIEAPYVPLSCQQRLLIRSRTDIL